MKEESKKVREGTKRRKVDEEEAEEDICVREKIDNGVGRDERKKQRLITKKERKKQINKESKKQSQLKVLLPSSSRTPPTDIISDKNCCDFLAFEALRCELKAKSS